MGRADHPYITLAFLQHPRSLLRFRHSLLAAKYHETPIVSQISVLQIYLYRP
jgi:hypothetical protein